MEFSASKLDDIRDFRLFNLAGFNWMFVRSVQAADNNQQIVEGIAARFAQHAGVRLDRVREALENFRTASPDTAILCLYTLKSRPGVFYITLSKEAELNRQLTESEYANTY